MGVAKMVIPKTVDRNELAELLGVSRRQVEKLENYGEIRPLKRTGLGGRGNKQLYDLGEIMRQFLELATSCTKCGGPVDAKGRYSKPVD